MKGLVFALTLALLGCANRSSSPPPVELKTLAGDWAAMNFIQEVQQTRSPHLAWFSKPLALSFSISPAQDGAGYEFARTNFHEFPSNRIVRLERTEETNMLRLVIEAPNRREGLDYVQLRLEPGESGAITTLGATNVWDGESEQRYLRLPVTLAHYINRIVIAGAYEDLSGAKYSFTESGQARWPDKSFEYTISLDPSEAGCEYIEHPDRDGVGGRKRYGYRWRNEQLELYNINYVSTANCDICCDPKPFVTLHRSK